MPENSKLDAWINTQGMRVLTLTYLLFATFSGTSNLGASGTNPDHLFKKYCFDCHSQDNSDADIDIQSLLTQRPFVANRKTWGRIRQLIELNAMPPSEADQPNRNDRNRMLKWIRTNVEQFDYTGIKHPGFEPIRRLTHREYDNTIRDLLGIKHQLTEKFPSEMAGMTGFENTSSTLFLQPALMERYIATAERAIESAIPSQSHTELNNNSLQLLFDSQPISGLDDLRAKKQLRKFLHRSFRRQPEPFDIDTYNQIYDQAREDGKTPLAALKQSFAAVLISPKFLLRIEKSSTGGQPRRLDDWELASRLSYFLWSSMPDNQLFELAQREQLSDPKILEKQVARMIADPRMGEFADSFSGQWLSTRMVGHEIRLDPIDNAWCTDSLMSAMRSETRMLFQTAIHENWSIDRLIDSDVTFVNEEIATTLYQLNGIHGDEMQKVRLAGERRGILGHASVLAVTSNYDETSPIKRGAYVLDRILGTPPPPPPPDAGELNEELAENDRLNLAEKLKRHASNERCNGCHSRIDPIGISMENYGAYGRRRSRYGGSKVRSTATLADGTKLRGVSSLRKYLLNEKHDDFVRNVVVRLMEYALGRPTKYFDEPAISKIIDEAKVDNFGFHSIIVSIVTSYPFQFRQELQSHDL